MSRSTMGRVAASALACALALSLAGCGHLKDRDSFVSTTRLSRRRFDVVQQPATTTAEAALRSAVDRARGEPQQAVPGSAGVAGSATTTAPQHHGEHLHHDVAATTAQHHEDVHHDAAATTEHEHHGDEHHDAAAATEHEHHEDEHHDVASTTEQHHEDEHHDVAWTTEHEHHEHEHHDAAAKTEHEHHEDEQHDAASTTAQHHENEHHDAAWTTEHEHHEDKHHDASWTAEHGHHEDEHHDAAWTAAHEHHDAATTTEQHHDHEEHRGEELHGAAATARENWTAAQAHHGQAKVQVVLANALDKDVQLFWVSPHTGEEVSNGVVPAKGEASIAAFLGHTFVGRVAGEAVLRWTADGSDGEHHHVQINRSLQATFVNRREAPVQLFWRSNDGAQEEVFIGEVDSGNAFEVDTVIGHNFVARAADGLVVQSWDAAVLSAGRQHVEL